MKILSKGLLNHSGFYLLTKYVNLYMLVIRSIHSQWGRADPVLKYTSESQNGLGWSGP